MRCAVDEIVLCCNKVWQPTLRSSQPELFATLLQCLAALFKSAGHFVDAPVELLRRMCDDALATGDVEYVSALFADPVPSVRACMHDVAASLLARSDGARSLPATRLLTVAAGHYPVTDPLVERFVLASFEDTPGQSDVAKQAALALLHMLAKHGARALPSWPRLIATCLLPSLSNPVLAPPMGCLLASDYETRLTHDERHAVAKSLVEAADFATMYQLVLAPAVRSNEALCSLVADVVALNLGAPSACAVADALCARSGVLFDAVDLAPAALAPVQAQRLCAAAVARLNDADERVRCPALRIVGFLWDFVADELKPRAESGLLQATNPALASPKVRWTAWNALSLSRHAGLCDCAQITLLSDGNFKAKASCVGALLQQPLADVLALKAAVDVALLHASPSALQVEAEAEDEAEHRRKYAERLCALHERIAAPTA